MKRLILSLLFFIFINSCFSQKTNYNLNYFSPKDYGKGLEALNGAAVQDLNGVLYFGNAGGILRYDGTSWSYIPVKNKSFWIKSLAVDENNSIYVGGQGEFGYLAPDKSGLLSYISLSDDLPDNNVPFSSVNRLFTRKNDVIFQSEEAIFIYTDGQITTILPETSFHASFLINDDFFVRERGIGIMKLTGKKLELVDGSEYLKDLGIFSIIESSDRRRFIVITAEDGFWSVDRDTFTGKKIETADSMVFSQASVYGAIRLKDGNIALNTISNGIIITDERFKILSVLNKDNGLKVNSVLCLIQDYQDNLWAGLDNGIVQILYSSPLSVYGTETGLSGNIMTIKRYDGRLYIGTTEGLYIQNHDPKVLSGSFEHFDGISKEIRGLCNGDGSLIVATRENLYEIRGNKLITIDNTEINSVYYSPELKILFVSGKNKLILYKYYSRWKKIREITEISEEVVRFEEETRNGLKTIWMGTFLNGVIRLQFLNSGDYEIERYNSSDGLIENSWVLPFKISDNVIFSQKTGLLSFIDEEVIKRQLPDSLKNRPEFYKGYFDLYAPDTSQDRINRPYYFIEDTKNRTYVYLDGDIGYFDKQNGYSFVTEPFSLTDIGKINVILHEDDGTCWVGGDDGLTAYYENYLKNYDLGYNTIITRATCGQEDSVIYCGYANTGTTLTDKKISGDSFILSHNLNTVIFSYTAPFFEGEKKLVYSTMLEGQDTAFSQWNGDTRIVYRNLWEGDYLFRVRAKNAYGQISSESDFSFRILSPWYRRPWVYVIYSLFAIGVIFTAIRLYARRLIAQNKRLEEIIQQRTHEIQEKNIKLEIQKEEILDSITYAHRIQNAVLPNDEQIHDWLGDHFIINRPKDIVSGDFYWSTILNQNVVFCVADCTGHGVPGAFMSMLCISLLNEIVCKEKINHTDIILNNVRRKVIEALQQKGVMGEQKDGMDISICIYNKTTSELEFSGANNPLYVVRKKEMPQVHCHKQLENDDFNLYEIKGDRMPISYYDIMNPFKRHVIKLYKEDRLYLFSDGICDQFGGPKGRRFMNNLLKSTLMETLTPEIKNQRILVENRLDEWQAYTNPRTGHSFDQVDDICVMGVKI